MTNPPTNEPTNELKTIADLVSKEWDAAPPEIKKSLEPLMQVWDAAPPAITKPLKDAAEHMLGTTSSALPKDDKPSNPAVETTANVSPENEKLLQLIKEKINGIRSYTPKVAVFGNSGVGKSRLCNALFGQKIAKISDVKACTRKPQEILLTGADGKSGICLVDVPGIGEDPARQVEYTKLYKSLAPELDLILWCIKADDRNYASACDTYQEVFSKQGSAPPVIFVITQTDKTNPIGPSGWNYETFKPSEKQAGNIAIKENDVSKRFDIKASNVISIATYSEDEEAPPSKSYNLQELLDKIVEVLPREKKYSLTREAKAEFVSEASRVQAEKGIWDSIKDFAGTAWDAVKDPAVDFIIQSMPAPVKVVLNVGKKVWDTLTSWW